MAKLATRQNDRAGFYAEAQTIVHNEAPWIPIAHSIRFDPVRKEVTGYKMDPTAHHDRHRRAEDRRQGSAGGSSRRFEGSRSRRSGARHRRALRARRDGDAGHRQRQGSLAARRCGRSLHPDRRGGHPRQLRWPAVRRQRIRGWHQCADLFAQRRLPGRVLRDPDRRRAEGEGSDRRYRQGYARPARRHGPGPQPVARRFLRHQAGRRGADLERRAWQRRFLGRPQVG